MTQDLPRIEVPRRSPGSVLPAERISLPVLEAPGEPILLCTASSASKDGMAPLTGGKDAKDKLNS